MVSHLPKKTPNNTATTNTTSPKQRDLSRIQRNKANLCDWYGGDGENGPSIPERIMVDTVENDEDIVPILEAPPVAATVKFSDMTTDTTKPIINTLPYYTGFKEVIKRTRRKE